MQTCTHGPEGGGRSKNLVRIEGIEELGGVMIIAQQLLCIIVLREAKSIHHCLHDFTRLIPIASTCPCLSREGSKCDSRMIGSILLLARAKAVQNSAWSYHKARNHLQLTAVS